MKTEVSTDPEKSYASTVIQRNPALTGFQLAPAGLRALAGFGLRDREHAHAGAFSGLGMIDAWTLADIQIRDADAHTIGFVGAGRSGR